MPIIRQLDKESRRVLCEISFATYLHGGCYYFALALHEGLGWPLVGLMKNGRIDHAAVRSPSGKFCDVRGFTSENKFGKPFGYTPPHDIRDITSQNLMRSEELGIIRDQNVQRARQVAEALWPKLPWKDSLAARVAAFAEGLEALSRRHKLWVRSAIPTARPLIAKGEDDEAGYELHPTVDGITFTIDRLLSSHRS